VGIKLTPRRLAAAGITIALLALVACDLRIESFRVWWDNHSLTASIVSSLLVLGVTALIVDEVVARRQRNDRATSVAVQAMIVYDQAQRAYLALVASLDAPDGDSSDAPEEMRALANMLLTSSPSLFDDPEARVFLERVQRLTAVMFRKSSSSVIGDARRPSAEAIKTAMDNLHASAGPLLQRLSAGYRAAIDEPA
jgi:hypothetical protein